MRQTGRRHLTAFVQASLEVRSGVSYSVHVSLTLNIDGRPSQISEQATSIAPQSPPISTGQPSAPSVPEDTESEQRPDMSEHQMLIVDSPSDDLGTKSCIFPGGAG